MRGAARTMAAHDGAVHDRFRGSLSRSFNPRRVEPLRAALGAHAVDVLAQMARNDRPDIVSDYARDLPLWLICEFLGLPQSSRREIDGFLAGTEEGFTDPPTTESRQRAEDGHRGALPLRRGARWRSGSGVPVRIW